MLPMVLLLPGVQVHLLPQRIDPPLQISQNLDAT